MKNILTLILFFLTLHISSQTANHKRLKKINQVWEKFYKAFENLDVSFMENIHSKEMVRVSGGKNILGYQKYMNNYKVGFENSKNSKQTSTISLRFFERINNDTKASERGIYKLTRNKNTTKEKSYYGQFHVIFIKKNDEWKILVDYDSNKGNKIGEKQFIAAYAINDFSKF